LLDPVRFRLLSAIGAIGVIGVAFGAKWSVVLLPGVAALGSFVGTCVTITVARLLREQEQTAILMRAFGRYVSPQILDHTLAYPEIVATRR